jgi:DNA-binding NarL/FixJ family response regulator
VPGADDAIGLLEQSVAELERSPDALELARSRIDLGAALRRAGRRSDALDPLRAGLDSASRCGADAVAERGRDELHLAGARPRRDAASGRDALTPGELRVATLAAAGRTNKEVAQELFVSLRTVETHLTHAYQKLDIGSRGELGEALAG